MCIPDDEAHAEMLSLGLEPLVPCPGLNTNWRSRCRTCKKTVGPTLSNARKTKFTCRYCAKRITDPETAPEIMADAGLRPLVPFPGNVKTPWPAVHDECGKEVAPALDKVIQRRRAPCWHCAKYGFQPGLPGYLYLMTHTLLGGREGRDATSAAAGSLTTNVTAGPWSASNCSMVDSPSAQNNSYSTGGRTWAWPTAWPRRKWPSGWTETVALIDRGLDVFEHDLL